MNTTDKTSGISPVVSEAGPQEWSAPEAVGGTRVWGGPTARSHDGPAPQRDPVGAPGDARLVVPQRSDRSRRWTRPPGGSRRRRQSRPLGRRSARPPMMMMTRRAT